MFNTYTTLFSRAFFFGITLLAFMILSTTVQAQINCQITGLPDADCDNIIDACDLCPGGDDSIDNNNDGLPDCAYPPAFEDIIDDWKCGNKLTKVLICHVPPGNPANAHTICVSPNAIDAHIAHDNDNGNHNDDLSDYLGRCRSIICIPNCDPIDSGGDPLPDSDCDGVCDAADLCPGGDDSIDNNGDGLPDCAFPPNFDDIIDAWKCGSKEDKVLICHVPPGNPSNAHTICVDPNAIPAHLAHDNNNGNKDDNFSDYLGNCYATSCIAPRIAKENTGFKVYPNPATDQINLRLDDFVGKAVTITIYNNTGLVVYLGDRELSSPIQQIDFEGHNLSAGVYFISVKSDESEEIQRLVITTK